MSDEKKKSQQSEAEPEESHVQFQNHLPIHPDVKFHVSHEDLMDDSDCNLDDSICSEYSDSDDVPPVDRYGRRVWDYFYIIKADLIKGLDEISCIYKKKSKMYGDLYQLFDRVPSSRLIKCCETRCYRIFFDEEELVRVQCKYIGRKKWFVVELMNVDITEADPANLLLQQHLSQLKL